MAKQLFKLNIHSIVDTITNSSSELFVLNDTKETVRLLEVILQNKWDLHCQLYNLPQSDVKDILYIEEADNTYMSRNQYLKEYNVPDIKEGTIIIHSSEDNSIPYEFQQFIENFFNAERHHLG
jgi:hypothetical protein